MADDFKEDIKLLSKDVVECMEIIDSFSLDGIYIDPSVKEGRMSQEESERIKLCYFSLFLNVHPRRLSIKKIIKKLKPIHKFIIGIYRNGTPSYRFESKKVDETIDDKHIIEQFAIAVKEKLIYND